MFKKYETRLKSIFVLYLHELINKQNADLDIRLTKIFAYCAMNALVTICMCIRTTALKKANLNKTQ